MNFTFGIITDGSNNNFLDIVIASIESQNILNYEIIIVGGNKDFGHTLIKFDETVKPAWITRKKNIISFNAKYDNVVYMHDYISLSDNWYNGFFKFGDDWDICMNKILNLDGTRFRDWCTWDDPDFGNGRMCYESWCGPNGKRFDGQPKIVPYTYNKTHYMYVSGAYWVAKKKFMMKNQLNETLSWGAGEDVEMSTRVRNKWNYKMNINSTVQLLKQKDRAFEEVF